MELAIVAILLLVGVLLMLAELFLLPGISIAGIMGVLSLGGSVFYAYAKIGVVAGHITTLLVLVLLGVAVYLFLKFRALDKMALKTDIESKVDTLEGLNIHIGDKGITASRLAPMGKVTINGDVAEAKTYGEFIDEDTEVVVVEVQNNTVIVEKL